MAIQLKLALGWTLFVSIMLNITLVGYGIWKARGIKRYLFIWSGGGFIPVTLKFGQKEHVWTRPDKTSVAFELDPEWSMPLGIFGRVWIGNGRSGQLMKWLAREKRWMAVTPKEAGEAARALGIDPDRPAIKGSFLRVDVEPEPVFPDGNWFASAIQDKREHKWFAAERQAAVAGKAVPWIVIGIFALAAIFILPKFLNGGANGAWISFLPLDVLGLVGE